jgi:hypothetical protein
LAISWGIGSPLILNFSSYSLATFMAQRALVRLATSSRHTLRRAPIPGSMSHQAPEAISIAERAMTVGPITGTGSTSSRSRLLRSSTTPSIISLAAA